jgi:hypothetical protein
MENPFDEMDRKIHWVTTSEWEARGHNIPRPLMKDGKSLEQYREELWQKIEKNPIYQQYTQHIGQRHKQLNTLPWHAIGERYYAAWQILACSMSYKFKLHGIQPAVSRTQTLVPIASMVLAATPYLWSHKMEKLADGAPLPQHTVSRTIMPYPLMFWSRESCYILRDDQGRYEGETNWIALVYMHNRCILIADIYDEEKKEMGLLSHTIEFQKLWPTDYEEKGEEWKTKEVGLVLKRCSFLNSPYVRGQGQRMAHHHRRQLQRAGVERDEINAETHVVTLRRRSGGAATSNQPSDAEHDYKHQWWVCGHHRAQWYPSEKAHKVIWIAPFIKGPEGAPLLEKIYSVVR